MTAATGRRGRPPDRAARARVLAAATTLFTRDGYGVTTVAGIAAEAGVSVQTIYSAFGSKLGIVSAAHDVVLADDDAPVPLIERAWAEEVPRQPSVEAACRRVVAEVTASTVRIAPLYVVVQSASGDPDVARLLADLHAQRHEFSDALARLLLRAPGVGTTVDPATVADVLYATLCVETHSLYVVECGWSVERWRTWACDTLVSVLTSG